MQSMISSLLPDLLGIISAILATVVTMAVVALRNYLTAKAGATTANHLIDLLHTALDTGVKAALVANPSATPTTIAAEAVVHAKASIPDIIASLAPDAITLTNIALSKLFATTAPTTSTPPGQ